MPLTSETVPNSGDLDGNELLNRAIEAYYNDIARAVGSRTNSQGGALDVVHDLYVKLAANPEVLREKRSIRAFLCRAAINLGIDKYRREQFEANLFSSIETEENTFTTETASPDHRIETEARIRILRDAIGELPARRRAVFILHRLHHLGPDEIAMKLNISRNMVNRHLRRALAHCLDRLLQMG
ncbi:MAG: RNA polymerase sigma factor [Pseudomonadota bacterium]